MRISNAYVVPLLFILLSCNKEFEASKTSAGAMRFYQNPSSFFIHTALPTPDGGRIMVGETAGDGFIYKLDAAGNEEWTRYTEGERDEYFWHVTNCADGGFLAVGATKSPSKGASNINFDGYAVRYSAGGNVEWEKVFTSTDRASFYTGVELADGSFVVAGTQLDRFQNVYLTWIVGLSADGDQLYSRLRRIGLCSSVGLSLAVAPNGLCVLAGVNSESCSATGFRSYQTFATQFNPKHGGQQWTKIYSNYTRGYRRSPLFPIMTILASHDGFTIGSSFEESSTVFAAQILRIGINGEELSERKYHGLGFFLFQQLQPLGEDGYLVLGASFEGDSSTTNFPPYNASMFQVSSAGDESWSSTIGGVSTSSIAFVARVLPQEIQVSGFYESKNKEQFHVFTYFTDPKGKLKNEK